jgi:alpha-D-xyloside xylohydrolase
MPVLVPAGSIIPTQAYAPFTPPGPPRSLILTAYPGVHGSFTLYDDAGLGFGYARHAYARTTITQTRSRGRTLVSIGPARGGFAGALRSRSWQVQLLDVNRPHRVRATQHERSVRLRWTYAAASRTLIVTTGAVPTRRALELIAR